MIRSTCDVKRTDRRDPADKAAVSNDRHIELDAVETAAVDDRRIEPDGRIAADDACGQDLVFSFVALGPSRLAKPLVLGSQVLSFCLLDLKLLDPLFKQIVLALRGAKIRNRAEITANADDVTVVTGDWTKSAAVCAQTRMIRWPAVDLPRVERHQKKLPSSRTITSQGVIRQTSF